MQTTKKVSHDVLVDRGHDFHGIRDDRNRKIGVRVLIIRSEYVAVESDYNFTKRTPGVYFYVSVRQTRNRVRFGGASSPGYEYATLEEAEQKAEQLITKRQKDYAKKFGQQQ